MPRTGAAEAGPQRAEPQIVQAPGERERIEVLPPSGDRPALRAPQILTVEPTEDYALLDSGAGEKLERYGPLTIRRPENQAIWPRRLPERAWEMADAIFTGDTDEEGTGRWRFTGEALGETWPLSYDGIGFHGRFTSFRHTGVFPEQAAHWRFVRDSVFQSKRPVRLLNLFGYTGLASLVAADAGAEVTHVDASKKAIGWARENQALAEMESAPIRWICEDAVRYCEREIKRGNTYDAILLDPPKFGRGPKGEVWQIMEDLPYLLALTRMLLSERALFTILTAYSIRSSFYSLAELMREEFRGRGGAIEAGELVIAEDGADPRLLSTSLFARWTA
ncbi:class I SAM-dependent methyltransferase [Fulvimarina sp. 2208YS6-2-32]|uniref:Class I SAM-dependent methyltransferase n=1 Tax=Fulvimarina uroteuthidis TaxID=3098149 RepID=A0ABU5HZ05_9HYPH|nr:class I SAM-dependent methyltransferase [Fulvimarina sp. 2208YS6-2-32]MDY8108117.1 class I SAM-dependent methyltransferase [Fulvimarina sp. 2208YS6-2-32]